MMQPSGHHKRHANQEKSPIVLSYSPDMFSLVSSNPLTEFINTEGIILKQNLKDGELDFKIMNESSNICIVLASGNDMLRPNIIADRVMTLITQQISLNEEFSFFVLMTRTKSNQKVFSDRQVNRQL